MKIQEHDYTQNVKIELVTKQEQNSQNTFKVSIDCEIEDEKFGVAGKGSTLLDAIKDFDKSYVNFTNMTKDEYEDALDKYKQQREDLK